MNKIIEHNLHRGAVKTTGFPQQLPAGSDAPRGITSETTSPPKRGAENAAHQLDPEESFKELLLETVAKDVTGKD